LLAIPRDAPPCHVNDFIGRGTLITCSGACFMYMCFPGSTHITASSKIAKRRRAKGCMSNPGTTNSLFVLILTAATCTSSYAQDAHTAQQASNYTFSANVSLASQYRYRGIMQTNNKPAIQGGFDLVHSSGFYIGNWNSSI